MNDIARNDYNRGYHLRIATFNADTGMGQE